MCGQFALRSEVFAGGHDPLTEQGSHNRLTITRPSVVVPTDQPFRERQAVLGDLDDCGMNTAERLR